MYDGDTLIREFDATGNLIAEYTWGLLGPLMMRRYDSSTQTWYTRYYVQDALGHTRLLVDNQGTITDTYRYDAWGNPLETGQTPNPFTWNGA